MVGLLVYGDNHFIVRGPLPNREIATALVQHWSLIQIGAVVPDSLRQWLIVSKAFREDLEWVVIIRGDGENSPAVKQLLEELSARSVRIHDARYEAW